MISKLVFPVRTVPLCFLAFAFVAGFSVTAQAEPAPPVDWHALPAAAQDMKQLDMEQRRIVRRVAVMCSQGSPVPLPERSHERNPCVLSSVDRQVRETGNPALMAYHAALPVSQRYNENRSTIYWRNLQKMAMEKQNAPPTP